jgi:predicted NAD-dependent protein-ADP-ribosyltransferase YbiA (DUF1768 family)
MSDFVYFNSSAKAPYNLLSNFSAAPIVLQSTDTEALRELSAANDKIAEFVGERAEFPSSEHLWHALKATDVETFRRFVVGGVLAECDASVFDVFFPGKGAAKRAYWMRKDNVGIIPKMAANPKYAKRLGFSKRRPLEYARERLPYGVERAVWMTTLRLKYKQNAKHRAVLLSTGKRTLVEFDRSASRAPVHWGGLITGDGTLLGENVMGDYTTAIREELKE